MPKKIKNGRPFREHVEVAKCVQKSLWLVLSASSVTTILPRKRRIIRTGWRRRSIADFAGSIHCIKKPNKEPIAVRCFAASAYFLPCFIILPPRFKRQLSVVSQFVIRGHVSLPSAIQKCPLDIIPCGPVIPQL